MDWTGELAAVGSVAVAMTLGGLIGLERELKDRPAGFRTHMLVAGAAALLVELGLLVVLDSAKFGGENLQVDPLRLVEAVVAGVSFIGAGTIFARRGSGTIAGITTAASLLMVAVIGVATGFGHYVLAAASTALTLLVLTLLNAFERIKLGKPQREDSDDARPRDNS